MSMIRITREELKDKYIEKHGIKEWIKLNGHFVEYPKYVSLEIIVDSLIRLRKCGLIDYYTIYEEHYLFSIDVTMENAFLEVYGKIKEEADEKRNTLKLK